MLSTTKEKTISLRF